MKRRFLTPRARNALCRAARLTALGLLLLIAFIGAHVFVYFFIPLNF